MAIVGCGASAAPSFDPRTIPRGQGAIAGRVVVRNRQSDVTSNCYVRFVDPHGESKAAFALPADGWIFTTVARGDIRLEQVVCLLMEGSSSRAGAHTVNDVDFSVPGGRDIAYFGQISIDLDAEPPSFWRTMSSGAGQVGGVLGVMLSIAVGPPPADGPGSLELQVRPDYASRMLRARYGWATNLRVLNTLTTHKAGLSGLQTDSTDVLHAEANLDGLRLTWAGIPTREPRRVLAHFALLSKDPQFASCAQLRTQIDEEWVEVAGQYHHARQGIATEETLTAHVELATLRASVEASHVEFELCGVKRTLDVPARKSLREFVRLFQLHVEHDHGGLAR
jgi:hypothetical protein